MRRLICTAVVMLVCALAPATAARAAAAGPRLMMQNVTVVPGGATKLIRATITAPESAPLTDYDVVFDIAAASRIVTIKAFGECVTTATRITCEGQPGSFHEAPLEITARPGAAIGATATLPVRAVAGGRTLASDTGRVTIAESVDLAAALLQDDFAIATGTTAGLAAGVRNAGDKPVSRTVLTLYTAQGFRLGDYRNCAPSRPAGVAYSAACVFDTVLEPGREYRLATPLRLTATDEVWAPSRWPGSLSWLTERDYLDEGNTVPRGSGPELRLVEAPATLAATSQTDVNPRNDGDSWTMTVTGSNRSNITARGATAEAEVGDTITVRVSVRNNGPARLEGYGAAMGSYLTVGVTPPAGTTVVGRPDRCWPFHMNLPQAPAWPPGAGFDDGNLYCFSDHDGSFTPYAARETVSWDIRLRVDRPGTLRGEIFTQVVAPAGAPQGDPEPADDKAAIVITAEGPAPGGGGGTGGGLPITGSDTTAVVAAGVVFLILGAAARLATRRR